jgi:hypothetical protein
MNELIFWSLAIVWMACVWRAASCVERACKGIATIAEQSRYQSEMLKYIAELLYAEVVQEDGPDDDPDGGEPLPETGAVIEMRRAA